MRIVLFLFLFLNLFGDEIQTYGGKIKLGDGNNGFYDGIIYKSKSEDETLAFKLGLKKLYIYSNNIKQTETYISLKQEIDLDEHIEFAFQNIKNNVDKGANIYILNFYKNDKVDYKAGISYSEYDLFHLYQLNFSLNRFIGNTPFYIEPHYYFLNIQKDRIYNSLGLKIGYIKEKSDVSLSYLGGENRYLVEDSMYYSCNFGYTTEYNYKFMYAYQLNRNFIVKLSYYYYKLKEINDLKAYNIALSYKY